MNGGETIEGLLYVPDLATSDPCYNVSEQYIPYNVTRKANLPSTDYSLIALAPWISPNCTKSYLAAAQGPARAFIFYLLNNDTGTPPPVNSAVWALQDGGQWKSTNKYPVYAVPMQTGTLLMQQLAQYPGNMTDVKNGHLLTEQYDSRDYVRLYTEIGTGSQTSFPSLWVFLLITLAILLFVVCVTSCLMHYIQYKSRQALRRRVASGEVDLEALGIKRMTVPQEMLDKVPLFAYVTDEKGLADQDDQRPRIIETAPKASSSPRSMPLPRRDSEPLLVSSSFTLSTQDAANPAQNRIPIEAVPIAPSRSALPHRQLPYFQSTCPICLDDFISHTTTVRELPCGHIYHPECIDPFLRENSSLCPVCKGKVLPQGFCPTNVTNAMVRRERLVRRMRERVTVEGPVEDSMGPFSGPFVVRARMASFRRQFGRARDDSRRISSAPWPGTVEMRHELQASGSMGLPPTMVQRDLLASLPGRRANAMPEVQRTAEDEDTEAQARLSKCKAQTGPRSELKGPY